MCTWEEIGQKWQRAQQMGWEAIQAAIEVGGELTRKKGETPHREFQTRVSELGIQQRQSSRLMRLHLHRATIEEHKPDSMRGALALLPKVPKKTSEEQLDKQRDEVERYEEFAKKTAKDQAEILARKKVNVELKRLQNQAHDAVMAELKAVKKELSEERARLGEVMREADEKKKFYQDLLNKRGNGYDYKTGLKILRQAVHPDRETATPQIREKAMDAINHISRFLDF